jgi:hypothetical protein
VEVAHKLKSKRSKEVLAGALVVHAIAVAFTWRDLNRRAPDEVRGNKKFWRAASGMNTMWSAAYWLFGRRRPA